MQLMLGSALGWEIPRWQRPTPSRNAKQRLDPERHSQKKKTVIGHNSADLLSYMIEHSASSQKRFP